MGWARYQFCRIYFKICRRGAPAKILKKFAVGPDFQQDLSNLRCGVGGWVRVIRVIRVRVGVWGVWVRVRVRVRVSLVVSVYASVAGFCAGIWPQRRRD